MKISFDGFRLSLIEDWNRLYDSLCIECLDDEDTKENIDAVARIIRQLLAIYNKDDEHCTEMHSTHADSVKGVVEDD